MLRVRSPDWNTSCLLFCKTSQTACFCNFSCLRVFASKYYTFFLKVFNYFIYFCLKNNQFFKSKMTFDLLHNEFSKMQLITFEKNLKKEASTIFSTNCRAVLTNKSVQKVKTSHSLVILEKTKRLRAINFFFSR